MTNSGYTLVDTLRVHGTLINLEYMVHGTLYLFKQYFLLCKYTSVYGK